MNTMQKVTAAASLLCVAVLAAAAAFSPVNSPDRTVLITLAGACCLAGAMLVVVFARGDVVARLQKGTIVLALTGASFTMAVAPFSRHIPGWRLRLARYPELRSHTRGFERVPDAMDAADSVISEHLLANQPGPWRRYGWYVVACARRNAVPVETVVAVIHRYDAELVAAEAEMARRRGKTVLRRSPGGLIYQSEVDSAIARIRERQHRVLDSVMAEVVWDKSGRRHAAIYVAPADVWAPDWLARLTLAGSELLAGFAIVIVLGLLRRKPRKAGETQHVA